MKEENLIIIIFLVIFLFLLILVFSLFMIWNKKKKNNVHFDLISEKITLDLFIFEVKTAIDFFAKKKVGALIILQGKKNLDNYIVQKGTLLNAHCSATLLKNIFYCRKTSLHDGAIIIDHKYQITYASVLVSVSKMKNPMKTSGSRHNAAFSVVTHTDSMVIAVSETTGLITFFENKKIKFKASLEYVVTKIKEWRNATWYC